MEFEAQLDMSSDPPERRRRTALGAPTHFPVIPGTLLLLVFVLPVTALAQGLSAADSGQVTDLVSQPSFLLSLSLAFLAVMILNGVFVAGDVAVDLLKSSHVKAVDEDSKEGRSLGYLFAHKESVVAACVLGAQTMRAWIVLLCLLPAPWLAQRLGWVGSEPTAMQLFGASLLAGALLSIPVMGVNVVFSELVAKSVASTRPMQTCLRLERALVVFDWIFKLPSLLAVALAGVVTRRFGTDARFTTETRAEEEIKEILESSEDSGDIEEEEREMLHSVFEFGDTVAREIMTPRVDLEAVPVDTSLREVARIVEESGHSRIPVYQENDDEIVGIVHAKDILGALARGQDDVALDRIMRPAMHVPENKDLHELLAEMRDARTQLVVLTDEFGGTSGIVTIEDIVEELVGEIQDEYDNELPEVVENGSGHSVSGKLHIDDVNAAIGTGFSSEEFDTIGGYVFGLFGRQPAAGEVVSDDDYRFVVEDSDGRRILRVKVEPLGAE